ncbi:TetR family transcriptional regulator [Streptomyces luteireticuli]|uniref:TetR/AcrR family transcriptional regulator n=1 Tax=Streptomyces luteireticuli TaxID=173858 RepID=UPI0035589497
MTGPRSARRPYDSARSRELLLAAAGELFTEKGFDRTTTRDIGERAGVDAALIARYFGGKTQLYLAVLRTWSEEAVPADLLSDGRLRALLARADRGELGPVLRTAVVPHTDPDIQDAARTQLDARLVGPLHDRFTAEGRSRPRLRAELAVAALTGILLARSTGALAELADADPDELLHLVHDLLASPSAGDDGN